MEAWLTKVEDIAREIAEREGCILYDLEHTGAGRGRILRVYIDKKAESVSRTARMCRRPLICA